MAVREIITYPHPILRQKAKPVTDFDEGLRELVRDMADTMYAAPGVGLAANQIAVPLAVVVIDITPKEEPKNLITLVNPKIVKGEGFQVEEEGCLSVIDFAAKVKRFERISVEAFDLAGNPLSFEAEDFYARVIQHEVDHLNGRLFIDLVSSLKRSLYKKKLKKRLQEEQEAA